MLCKKVCNQLTSQTCFQKICSILEIRALFQGVTISLLHTVVFCYSNVATRCALSADLKKVAQNHLLVNSTFKMPTLNFQKNHPCHEGCAEAWKQNIFQSCFPSKHNVAILVWLIFRHPGYEENPDFQSDNFCCCCNNLHCTTVKRALLDEV